MNSNPDDRLSQLLDRKKGLLDSGDRLLKLTSSMREASTASVLDDFLNRFRSTRFLVLVVGDFKSGKSTLVNALIGRRLCPVKATPKTAKVTRVSSMEAGTASEEVEIAFLEDRPNQRLPLGEAKLDDLVAVKGASTDAVQLVDVFIKPGETLLRYPLRLVDTPGLGSIEEGHSAVTREYVQHADVVLFVFSASKPVTEAERAFLLLNRSLIDRTVFVVNQIDRVAGEEADVLQYVRDALQREVLPAESPSPQLFPVSGLRALEATKGDDESGVPELVAAIETHLAERPFSDLLKSIHEQQSQICSSLQHQTSLAIGALETASQSAVDFLPAVETLRNELEQVSKEHVRTRITATQQVARLYDQVPGLTEQLRGAVANKVREWVGASASEEDCKRDLPAFLALGLTNAVEQLDQRFSEQTTKISEGALLELSHLFNLMEKRTREVLTPKTPIDAGSFGRGVAALSGLSAFAEQMGGPQGGYGAATAAVKAALSPSPEVRLLSIGAAASLVVAALGGPVSWLFAGVASLVATFFGLRHSSTWRERVVRNVLEKLDVETLPSVTAALQHSLANFSSTLSSEIGERAAAVLSRLLSVVDQVTYEVKRGQADRDAERARLAAHLDQLNSIASEIQKHSEPPVAKDSGV